MKAYCDIVNEWKNKKIKTEYELDAALDNYRILFAYNSNAIENEKTTYHDTREIFENGNIINYTGELRTLFEINNQRLCYEYLKPLIIRKEPITISLIKKVHGILMNGCYDEKRYAMGERPGELKKHDYIVGDEVGINPEEVEKTLSDLCKEISEYKGSNILTSSAYFHLNFESIHPFADGNGRVGRTIMNYNFMINDYPPTIIYNQDKKAYYMALAIFDKTREISGFEKFLKEEAEKTWNIHKVEIKPLESYVEDKIKNDPGYEK